MQRGAPDRATSRVTSAAADRSPAEIAEDHARRPEPPASATPLRRRPLARRVLAFFASVVAAFLVTAVAGLIAQRQAAEDVASLSRGYLPLEVALAGARAAQSTMAAFLDRLLDDPRAAGTTKEWVQIWTRQRPYVVSQARQAAQQGLGDASDGATRQFGLEVVGALDEIDRGFAEAARALPDLFGALESGDHARVAQALRSQSALERANAERLAMLSDRIGTRRAAVVVGTVARDRRAIALSVGLALLSLVVAAFATREVQRRLLPLARLTARAQSIAAGDRSPLPALDERGRAADEIGELSVAFGAMVDNVVARDAELLRLQRRQEDIVDHLRAAIVALDRDGHVEAANPAALRLLGVRVGDRLPDAAPSLWGQLGADVGRAAAEGVEPEPRSALTLAASAGRSSRVVDARVVPLRSETDERLALLVVDDVSEEAAARARALQAERLAAIGKMAAHVTHEIRNPLSSIGLNVELLEETLSSAHAEPSRLSEARTLLSAIAREVGRLSDVSEEYLRVARMPQPELALTGSSSAKPTDLCALLRDVLLFARPELERARVGVSVVLPDTPCWVAIDEAQVRKALLNLLRNAREAMEDGGTVGVSLSSSGNMARLDVIDDGPGIAEELRARIFDPFFTTKATGTGLGLPLTRQIIEAYGGTIACLPAPPRGTRFSITFPLAAPPPRD